MNTILQTSALWIFLREILFAPVSAGAVWPSSSRLAAQVPLSNEGWVVELGAGTGVVTQALLDRGVNPARLVVVERHPPYAQYLRSRFPSVQVIEGDASALADLLPHGVRIDTIVSSLPLRSLPRRMVAGIRRQWRRVLAPAGIVIQFTYDLRHSRRERIRGFAVMASKIIWRNIPPARVLTLRNELPRPGSHTCKSSLPTKKGYDIARTNLEASGAQAHIDSSDLRTFTIEQRRLRESIEKASRHTGHQLSRESLWQAAPKRISGG